jgi:predicted DNA-binding transcriptional regulator AlpA
MRPLNLQEAAQFLRMSKSSLYQRKDIPRYRRPGSRVMLFDQDELEAWLKQGRVVEAKASTPQAIAATNGPEGSLAIVDISASPIYHRSARYR